MAAADTPDPESGPQPTAHDSDGMTRRDLFRRTAATGTALGGMMIIGDRVVPQFSPIGRAQAIAATTALTLAAGAAIAGIIIGALATGSDDGSADQINEARANELHDRIWLDGQEMRMSQTPLLESLEGDVAMLRQICRSDAAFALMQAASDGKSETNATADAKAAVEDAIASVEANFFDAWSSEMTRIHNRAQIVEGSDNLGLGSVFGWIGHGHQPPKDRLDPTGTSPTGVDDEVGVELSNGTTHTVTVILGQDNSGSGTKTIPDIVLVPWGSVPSISSFDNQLASGDPTNPWASYDDSTGEWTETDSYGNDIPGTWGTTIHDRESADSVEALNAVEWWKIHNRLKTVLQEEKANVDTMVSTMYQDALNGEIDLHEISSASAILNQANTLDTWKEAAGIYKAMRMPEAEDPAVVELQNGVRLEGQLFWSDPADDGLPVGELINVDNTIGRIYLAGQIRHVPETPASEKVSANLAVVDNTDSASAVTDATVTMKGSDQSSTTDGAGTTVGLETDPGPTTYYINDGAMETAVTIDVVEGEGPYTVTHDGGDRTSVNLEPFEDETITPEDEGTVVIPKMSDDFELVGVHERPDAESLKFVKPLTVAPDDDFATQQESAKQAAADEEETRSETTEIVIEETSSDDGSGIGLPTFFDGEGGGMLGLGLIGVVVLAVVGIVTDTIPGLGN